MNKIILKEFKKGDLYLHTIGDCFDKLKEIMNAALERDVFIRGKCPYYHITSRNVAGWGGIDQPPTNARIIPVIDFHDLLFGDLRALLQTGKITLDYMDKGKDTNDNLCKLRAILSDVFPGSRMPDGNSIYYRASNSPNAWATLSPGKSYVMTVEDFYESTYKPIPGKGIKKLIGYKLSGIVSAKDAAHFLDCSDEVHNGLFFSNADFGGKALTKAEKTKVLDIWFTPVYEEILTHLKVVLSDGSAVKVTKDGIEYDIQFTDVKLPIEFIKAILKPIPLPTLPNWNINSTGFSIGCKESPKFYTRDDAEKVIEAHNTLTRFFDMSARY